MQRKPIKNNSILNLCYSHISNTSKSQQHQINISSDLIHFLSAKWSYKRNVIAIRNVIKKNEMNFSIRIMGQGFRG